MLIIGYVGYFFGRLIQAAVSRSSNVTEAHFCQMCVVRHRRFLAATMCLTSGGGRPCLVASWLPPRTRSAARGSHQARLHRRNKLILATLFICWQSCRCDVTSLVVLNEIHCDQFEKICLSRPFCWQPSAGVTALVV